MKFSVIIYLMSRPGLRISHARDMRDIRGINSGRVPLPIGHLEP